MTAQLQLPLATRRPASRSTDRGGSLAAEDYINSSGKKANDMRLVLLAFYAHPGVTTKELSRLTGLDRYMVARRAVDLMPSTRKDGRTGPLFTDLLQRSCENGEEWRWQLSGAGLAVIHLINGYNYPGRT